jgi:hypothetical protein
LHRSAGTWVPSPGQRASVETPVTSLNPPLIPA